MPGSRRPDPVARLRIFSDSLSYSLRPQLLTSTKAGEVSKEGGAPSIIVHRVDLLQTLLDALDAEQINTAKECVGVTQDEDGVTVDFADQTQVRGDVAIGADGIRSTVAASMFGARDLRYSGYHCSRAMAETPDVPRYEGIWVLLPGIQFALLPDVRPGESYWGACKNAPIGAAACYTDLDQSAQLRTILARLPGALGEMVTGTNTDNIFVDDIFDRPSHRLWGRGRVSLLGDFAHPMTPTFGQGACMAIEDAVTLANSLQQATDPVSGLRSYEKRRRRRTTATTNLSW